MIILTVNCSNATVTNAIFEIRFEPHSPLPVSILELQYFPPISRDELGSLCPTFPGRTTPPEYRLPSRIGQGIRKGSTGMDTDYNAIKQV